ncbi:YaiI/YqxD family protein, partial [candidate division CSSED10-310 bacterium]
MKIWIDADACPKGIRKIVVKASNRLHIPVRMVANNALPEAESALIKSITVPKGFDVADEHIVNELSAGDIVITADIPLAAQVVEKGALAIDPRGELYTVDNVYERLATRNLLQDLKFCGLTLTGPPPFSPADKRKFAATLDSLLTKLLDP